MKIEEVLDSCLEDIRYGGASIQDCLSRYPQFADELEPLLRLALRLDSANEVRPSQEFKARLRRQIQENAEGPQRARSSLRALLNLLLSLDVV